ncbi:MBL fold metallo-hydrolase [Mannheimia granulomatis]|uniref:MBL fold metallo-hydrolase n=1 Tax=Mannheimia granulomatis TaxID=85402 RepID=UPI00047CDAA3|nr:MBL fold metallo-hydrolase [Mannheimia granulomatis]QLB19414.1 multidrug transporter [Mannheimia granulomatis]
MIFSLFKWLVYIAITLAILGFSVLTFNPVFGGKPDAESLAKIKASPNYRDRGFVNLEETFIQTGNEPISWKDWLWHKITPPKERYPAKPLPTMPLALGQFKNGSMAWLGHSSMLFQTDGKFFLTDPLFYSASPVSFMVKPFAMEHTPTIEELPDLDAVLISHDHYDHLDYYAIQQLDSKTKKFIVPLGVKGHLQRWGIASDKITELDWDESANVENVKVTLVPARHFSGRSITDQNSTLWGGFVVKSPDISLYFSADSGYGKHYRERIARYGPFDFVMIENGAYNSKWDQIHEFPEQAVQALLDVKSTKAMPIHWAKFNLSEHHWTDPIERFLAAVSQHNIDVATPKIGEVFNIFEPLPKEKWWEAVK